MALETKLYQKLTQQLVMTPQLRQAIKILQVSRTELETLIDEELAENPVLEEGVEQTEEEELPRTEERLQPEGNGTEEWGEVREQRETTTEIEATDMKMLSGAGEVSRKVKEPEAESAPVASKEEEDIPF